MRTTKIPLDYQPATLLRHLCDPEKARRRFTARRPSQARAWQRATRAVLRKVLGLNRIPSTPPLARRLEWKDKGDYLREKWDLRTTPWSRMPFYLLLPKHVPRPLPVVLAFHGHSYGVKDIVGLWEDGAERDTPSGCHKDFGIALCRSGFAVAAPEISCFGERQTDFSHLNTTIGEPAPPSSCDHSAMLAFHLGMSVIGLRAHEALRLVDFLERRRDLDLSHLGAMGISGGGMHTFFSACLDTRIKAAVISGYFSLFRNSILQLHHCPCNFAPGLYEFGEIYDLAGLIAPRPILVENGTYDCIFPIKAVKQAVRRTRAVYRVFNAAGGVATDFFEGRHEISGRRAYDFLREKLR